MDEMNVEPIEAPEEKIYRIPEGNFSALESRISKLSNRAIKLDLPPITIIHVGEELELWIDRDHLNDDSKPCRIDLLEGESITDAQARVQRERKSFTPFLVRRFFNIRIIGGRPKLNGWEFVATIEHTDAGNILRTVPGFPEKALPQQFRKATNWCDHCQTDRKRIDTYIVRREDGTFKQIGRSCLKDFLGHADPHFVAHMAEILSQIVEIYGSDEGWEGSSGSGPRYFGLMQVLTASAAIIRLIGFTSKKSAMEYDLQSTSSVVLELLDPPKMRGKEYDRWCKLRDKFTPTDDDVNVAAITLEWAENLPEDVNNDYFWNLRVVAHLETINYTKVGLAASMIPAYRRENEARAEREHAAKNTKPSEYIGLDTKTTDKKTGKEKWAMFNFTATVGNIVPLPDNGFGPSYLYRMVDSNGNQLVWITNRGTIFVEGTTYEMRGKVKKHAIYTPKNTKFPPTKQTELSNVTLVKELVLSA